MNAYELTVHVLVILTQVAGLKAYISLVSKYGLVKN